MKDEEEEEDLELEFYAYIYKKGRDEKEGPEKKIPLALTGLFIPDN
jgi:hypothetical protein